MTWARKRQIFYIFVLLVFLSILGYSIISPNLNKEPTCTDRLQNGNEVGVDCGGSCARACLSQVDDIDVLWARSFKVIPGRYNAVAYLENHNKNEVVDKINYRFRFADKDNIYIGKREGSTFVPAGSKFAVFEPAINVGNAIPVYTTFEFISFPDWVKVDEEKLAQVKILSSDVRLENEDTSPSLSATLYNKSLFTIPEVGVVVILYDANGNALGVSSSFLPELLGQERVEVSFTWPEVFSGRVVSKEIIPLFNIFKAKLQ